MKKVFHHILDYAKSTFSLRLYGSIVVLLMVLLTFNYTLNFEKAFIHSFYGNPIRALWFFLIEYIPYLATCGLIVWFTDQKNVFRQSGFWLSSFFIFAVLGISRGAYFEKFVYQFDLHHYALIYCFKILDNLEGIVLVILPILLFYWIVDRQKFNHYYGLKTTQTDFRPYVVMLGIMAVPVAIAATTSGFQVSYPMASRAKFEGFAAVLGISKLYTFLVFEFFYLVSFFSVELLFRGFMVYSLKKYLGDYVVLPMVVAYAVLHFGKPIGETLGSIGGGCILGVLALKTNNIYGGIFIHIGVAFLMEIAAFLVKSM